MMDGKAKASSDSHRRSGRKSIGFGVADQIRAIKVLHKGKGASSSEKMPEEMPALRKKPGFGQSHVILPEKDSENEGES